MASCLFFRPRLEQLEDRCTPSVFYWHPSVGNNWSTVHNWRTASYDGIDMGGVPDVSTDVAVFDHADNCTLDANQSIQEVRFLATTTTHLSIGAHSLQVTTFTFHAGVIDYAGGSLKYFGNGAGIWDGSADMTGSSGTFWLRDGADLNIQGVGSKSMNVEMRISDTATTVPSAAFVSDVAFGSTSYLDLGATGKITVDRQGTLQFSQAGTFVVASGTGNANSIVSDSWATGGTSYSTIAANSGITQIYVPIVNNDVGAELLVASGATLTVDDPGNTWSVYEAHGLVQLASGCVLNAVDGYIQTSGVLALTGTTVNGNVVTTGNFSVSNGTVTLNLNNDAGHCVWSMGSGYSFTLTTSSPGLFMHASVTNGADLIQVGAMNYGGTLAVKSDASVAMGSVFTLISADSSTGSFSGAYDSWTATTPLLSTDYTISTANSDYTITHK